MAAAAILAPQPEIHLVALCYDCRKRHRIVATPATWLARLSEWEVKHRGHRIEFRSKKRRVPAGIDERAFEAANVAPWWLDFAENADIKLAYAASAAYTCTLGALATSSTLTAGRESTAIDNTTNKYLDYLVGGKVTAGTTPTTAKTIQIWAYGSVNDTPTYPDVFDGTDSAETVTSADIRNAALALLGDTATDATSDRPYWFRPVSLAAAFGGIVPKFHGLWITHDTAVNLNVTDGNHVLNHTGAYATSA